MNGISERQFQIRRMTLADVDGVHAIETASFPKPWNREDFVKEMTSNACARYLVAEEAGEIIGFAGAWIVLDEAHITNIAVLKTHRGRGIGRALTEALMQYAANLGVVYATLEVRRSNEIAQNLYKYTDVMSPASTWSRWAAIQHLHFDFGYTPYRFP